GAGGFYARSGFVIPGGAPQDGQGNRFPVRHMKLNKGWPPRRPPCGGFSPPLFHPPFYISNQNK
ncbi:hypothetical protein MX038_11650, partial [Serratia marcescens]|nr:hypothetical protein [Serratia marcescens]